MSEGETAPTHKPPRRPVSAKEQARRVAQGKEIGAKAAAAYKALAEGK